MTQSPRDEPVFNRFQRKIYRPFYKLREFQIGLVCIAGLSGVLGWVLWRGCHPDPALFTVNERFLTSKGTNPPVYKRPVETWGESGGATRPTAALGPFPADVAGDGWTAPAPVAEFDDTNLHVKIDGRETVYKSFGFKRLYCLALSNGQLSIDIELFDLGTIGNALGALTAEVTKPDAEFDGFFYASANAGFLVQGRYYARLIGSDDNTTIRTKIAAIKTALLTKLPAETVPWAYALLATGLKVSPAKVQYTPQDAFSFDFATEVYSAKINGETEVFVSRRANAGEASALAGKFADAFRGFGKAVPTPQAKLFANSYVTGIDGVTTEGEYVLGVRLAPTPAEALRWLNQLREVLKTATVPAGNGHGG